MNDRIGILGFDIDLSKVPHADIQEKLCWLSPKHKTILAKKYGSAHDFLVLLYHLLFVEQLQKSEIARILDCRPQNIHHQLYELGWGYSENYIENKKRDQEKLAQVDRDVRIAKKECWSLDVDQDMGLKGVLEKAQLIGDNSWIEFGFESKEEYARVMYYMKHKMRYKPKEFIPLFHRSLPSMNDRLCALGLNNTYKEGISTKIQDYDKSLRNARITTTTRQAEKFSHGSINQDYFRSQLSKMIYKYIPGQKYEVVVGFSDTGILGGGLEIDIPVVVHDVIKKIFFRIAIEYGAKVWHPTKRDMAKKMLCEQKGWHVLQIFEDTIGVVSNNPKRLDPLIRETCERIRSIVHESNVAVMINGEN